MASDLRQWGTSDEVRKLVAEYRTQGRYVQLVALPACETCIDEGRPGRPVITNGRHRGGLVRYHICPRCQATWVSVQAWLELSDTPTTR